MEKDRLPWPVRPKTPKYYFYLEVLAFCLGYTAFLIAEFFAESAGLLSSLGLFAVANIILGIVSGAISTNTERALGAVVITLFSSILLAFFVLSLPTTLGVLDESLVTLVELRMTLQVVPTFLTFPAAFIAVFLGTGVHDSLGLPEK